MVRARGLEPPWGCPHTDLNRTRLPIPPRPRIGACLSRRECILRYLSRVCKPKFKKDFANRNFFQIRAIRGPLPTISRSQRQQSPATPWWRKAVRYRSAGQRHTLLAARPSAPRPAPSKAHRSPHAPPHTATNCATARTARPLPGRTRTLAQTSPAFAISRWRLRLHQALPHATAQKKTADSRTARFTAQSAPSPPAPNKLSSVSMARTRMKASSNAPVNAQTTNNKTKRCANIPTEGNASPASEPANAKSAKPQDASVITPPSAPTSTTAAPTAIPCCTLFVQRTRRIARGHANATAPIATAASDASCKHARNSPSAGSTLITAKETTSTTTNAVSVFPLFTSHLLHALPQPIQKGPAPLWHRPLRFAITVSFTAPAPSSARTRDGG